MWLSYRNDHTTQKDLADLQKTHVPLTPIANGLSALRGQYSQPLKMLMALTGIVLLIACANIANLLLARSTARAREFAVRQALGARRSRLIRQLLTESLLLATIGGALGIALAALADRFLLHMISSGPDTISLDVSIHLRLLLFTLAVTVFTALLFGTLPALRAAKLELTEVSQRRPLPQLRLRQNLRSPNVSSSPRSPSRSSFWSAPSSSSAASSISTMSIPASTATTALVLNLDPSSIGYMDNEPRLTALYQQIEQRVAAVHSVTSASFASFTFAQGSWNGGVFIPGGDSTGAIDVKHNVIGSDYFKAMDIPLIAGRNFGPQDTATSQIVAIISERFANTYFPNTNPIGRELQHRRPQ